MNAPAAYWRKEQNGQVRCLLCPHVCLIPEGGHGKCLIRVNRDGELIQTAYGEIVSASLDPIEKKPLYHFYPASNILSVGTNGCNMSCLFCQNWQISTQDTHRQEVTPSQLLKTAKDNGSIGIAYTYNEPLIWFEFVRDCAKVFHDAGLKNVLVTNGMINHEPLAELLPLVDAFNVDIKGFTGEFYNEHGGHFKTVKNTIEAVHTSGKHLELTNLVIPDKNDDPDTFVKMCEWVAGMSRDIPLHLSRYFPQYRYTAPVTPNNTLTGLAKTAKNYLNYVYIGNADIKGMSDTLCPKCGKLIIERSGYSTILHTDKNICPDCMSPLPLYL